MLTRKAFLHTLCTIRGIRHGTPFSKTAHHHDERGHFQWAVILPNFLSLFWLCALYGATNHNGTKPFITKKSHIYDLFNLINFDRTDSVSVIPKISSLTVICLRKKRLLKVLNDHSMNEGVTQDWFSINVESFGTFIGALFLKKNW